MSRRKRGVEEEEGMSQESLSGAIGKMGLRSTSGSLPVSRQNSSVSVISIKSEIDDGSQNIDTVARDGCNIATISCVFEDNTKQHLAPQNTQFCFNPQDDVQMTEVKAKLAKIKQDAVKLKAAYKVIVLSGTTQFSTITKVGGASMNYTTKRFPPTDPSWLKNTVKKARKVRVGTAPKKMKVSGTFTFGAPPRV